MMHSHVEVRLLDAAGRLLAASLVPVEARNRCVTALGAFEGPGEADGAVAEMVVFWPALAVQKRTPMVGVVAKGAVVRFPLTGPLIAFSSDEGPLPPITFRQPVVVSPPTGGAGLR
jgi:hypothetical protein